MQPKIRTHGLAIAGAVASFVFAPAAFAQGLPEGPGKATYEAICGGCHGADIVVGSVGNRDSWTDTVERMKGRGAIGSDQEFETVIDYLVQNFGPAPAKPAAAPAKGNAAPAPVAASAPKPAPAATSSNESGPSFWIIFMPWRWF